MPDGVTDYQCYVREKRPEKYQIRVDDIRPQIRTRPDSDYHHPILLLGYFTFRVPDEHIRLGPSQTAWIQ